VFDEYCKYNNIVAQIVDKSTYASLCVVKADVETGCDRDLSARYCFE
jgi:hypothetical protein